jgi:ribose transport system ATP-binding protein
MKTVLEVRNLTLERGGVAIVRGVDFDLRPGEVHAVVGANGAGKSSLMKVLAGLWSAPHGTVRVEGKDVHFRSPREARQAGIVLIPQEVPLFTSLQVMENVVAPDYPRTRFGSIDWKKARTETVERLAEWKIEASPEALLETLPLGLRQQIEIVRGVRSGAKILLMDEPTSSLSPDEVEELFRQVRRHTAAGGSVVYISHFLEEVLALADRVTVLRDGARVWTGEAEGETRDSLQQKMWSELATASSARGERRSGGEPVLHVKDWTRRGDFSGVEFQVNAGQVVGIYGQAGAGQERLALSLAGGLRVERGELHWRGQAGRFGSIAEARRAGLGYLAENRRDGVFTGHTLVPNLTSASLEKEGITWRTTSRETTLASRAADALGDLGARRRENIEVWSGGQQQRALLARWHLAGVQLLIVEEPTRGMDLRAKEAVREAVLRFRAEGRAVVIVSAEPELIEAWADEAYVMRRGQLRKMKEGWTARDLMEHGS